jgi:hypothetical protein
MDIHRVAALLLLATVLVGLGASYFAALIGVLGIIDARSVSFATIVGASIALVAAAVYFAGYELRLRRSL